MNISTVPLRINNHLKAPFYMAIISMTMFPTHMQTTSLRPMFSLQIHIIPLLSIRHPQLHLPWTWMQSKHRTLPPLSLCRMVLKCSSNFITFPHPPARRAFLRPNVLRKTRIPNEVPLIKRMVQIGLNSRSIQANFMPSFIY
jgi:hypothetical protein